MNHIALIICILLFVLLVSLPFILDRLMKLLHSGDKNKTVYLFYFSALILLIVLCLAPVMIIFHIPILLLINIITLPFLPWLIYKRFQFLSAKKANNYSFLYFLIFEAILLFFWLTLLIVSSQNVNAYFI